MWEHIDVVPRKSEGTTPAPVGNVRALVLLVLAALIAGLLPLVN
jgi:hypothetical protein